MIINSLKELLENISNMDRENSVIQFTIPGKGKFTLVFQEEDYMEKKNHVNNDNHESLSKNNDDKKITTSEFINLFYKDKLKH